MLTTAELTTKLAELGFSLETKLVKDGGWGKQSDWEVTLKYRTGEFKTEFHNGLRKWVEKPKSWEQMQAIRLYGDIVAKCYRRGQLVSSQPKNNIASRDVYIVLTVPVEPIVTDVLYCLLSDAGCVMYGQSFEDFCSEIGYNPDSISHKKIYDACTDIWRALIRMGVNVEELQKLFQDF